MLQRCLISPSLLVMNRRVFQAASCTISASYSSSSSLPTSSSSSSVYDYDVLISGGGVVGASLAASLLRSPEAKGLKIALVESRKPKSLAEITQNKIPSIPFHQVYAISPASIQFLKETDSWNAIAPRSHPYTSMQVWEAAGPGFFKISASDTNVEELGRICENDTILAALYDSIERSGSSCDLFYGYAVTSLVSEPLSASTGFSDKVAHATITDSVSGANRTITSRLVVGADGANSAIRKLAGISTWGWSYSQNAIVATVKLDSVSSNQTCWQRYLKSGPLALLPLWDGYSSIVWSTSIQEAKRLVALPDDVFLVELNAALRSPSQTDRWSVFSTADTAGPLTAVLKRAKLEGAAVLDTIMSAVRLADPPRIPPRVEAVVSKRVAIPLSLQKASSYTAPRVALIGDAAHSIHPQAGQGLNLGLMDAKHLSSSIVKGLCSGCDIGDDKLFLSPFYGKLQSMKNLQMMGSVDILDRIFSSELKFVSFLRSFGMLGIHGLQPLKAEIAKFAMGSSSRM